MHVEECTINAITQFPDQSSRSVLLQPDTFVGKLPVTNGGLSVQPPAIGVRQYRVSEDSRGRTDGPCVDKHRMSPIAIMGPTCRGFWQAVLLNRGTAFGRRSTIG